MKLSLLLYPLAVCVGLQLLKTMKDETKCVLFPLFKHLSVIVYKVEPFNFQNSNYSRHVSHSIFSKMRIRSAWTLLHYSEMESLVRWVFMAGWVAIVLLVCKVSINRTWDVVLYLNSIPKSHLATWYFLLFVSSLGWTFWAEVFIPIIMRLL